MHQRGILRARRETAIVPVTGSCASRLPGPDRAVVEQLWRDFADLGPLERHAIDTGATSAEATAEALARRLRDELLVA